MCNIQEPSILTANCFNWLTSNIASSRRYSEEKRIKEVANYLRKIGFTVEEGVRELKATTGEINVTFSYEESCKNVYKSLSVYVEKKGEWKKSNITAIRKQEAKRKAELEAISGKVGVQPVRGGKSSRPRKEESKREEID